MNEIENAINNIFKADPEAMVMVTVGENPKAIMYKGEWEDGEFDHVKSMSKEYKLADFFQRAEVPFIGIVVKLPLEKKGGTKES